MTGPSFRLRRSRVRRSRIVVHAPAVLDDLIAVLGDTFRLRDDEIDAAFAELGNLVFDAAPMAFWNLDTGRSTRWGGRDPRCNR